MRILAAVLLAVLAACATAAPAADTSLSGRYRLAEVNGQPMPTRSPTERNVMLESAVLELMADGSYSLQVTARADGQPSPQSYAVRGTWRVEGDVFTLAPEAGSDVPTESFQFVHDAARLRMRDERGDEWVWART